MNEYKLDWYNNHGLWTSLPDLIHFSTMRVVSSIALCNAGTTQVKA